MIRRNASREDEAMANWSELPPELLQAISSRLTLNADYVRFHAVCISWRSSRPATAAHLPPQLPWLMLPHDGDGDGDGTESTRRFLDLAGDNKIHRLDLPETRGAWCCGSSRGWLVTVRKDATVALFNPLTRARIPLPPLTTFPHVLDFDSSRSGEEFAVRADDGAVYTLSSELMRNYFINKAILSDSPSSNTAGAAVVVAAVLYASSRLALCRPGDQKWTLTDMPSPELYLFLPYSDVAYYEGKFYVIDKNGKIMVCENHREPSPNLTLVRIVELLNRGIRGYFVESEEEMLLVLGSRYALDFDLGSHRTEKFKVFKLSFKRTRAGKEREVVRVKNLGDRALFVGGNHSLSISASSFPGCRGNCIYFTDDYLEGYEEGKGGGHDFGVYCLKGNNRFDWLRVRLGYRTLCIWPPPIWIAPSLC